MDDGDVNCWVSLREREKIRETVDDFIKPIEQMRDRLVFHIKKLLAKSSEDMADQIRNNATLFLLVEDGHDEVAAGDIMVCVNSKTMPDDDWPAADRLLSTIIREAFSDGHSTYLAKDTAKLFRLWADQLEQNGKID